MERKEPESQPRRSSFRSVLIGLAIVAGVLVLWELALKDRFVPKNFGVVVPGEIYRSGRLTSSALARVADDRDIRTVIDFGAYDEGTAQWRRIQQADARLGLHRIVLPMSGDGTGNPDHYAEALRILADETAHPVLVQCAAGAQRTGMCILLYRNLVEDVPLGAAYEESFRYGHDPADNWKFLLYLGRNLDHIDAAFHEGPFAGESAADTAVVDGAGGPDEPAGSASP